MKLKPYPEYKDSGVPWLGQIPAHWDLKPGFAFLSERKKKNTGMKESTVLSLSYGQIVIKPSEKLHGLVPESFETYQIADPGNIIIRGTDLQNDKISLRVGKVRNRGIITSAYICLSVNQKIDDDYAYLLLHGYDLMKVYYGMGSGLRQNLDFSDFKRLPILLPTGIEQKQICRYMGLVNTQINKFIRNKRRLIALLKEQKQNIINEAVTRGLDTNVKLKPSGVDWIGDIPEHWEVRRVKTVIKKLEQGWSPSASEGELRDGQWAVLTLSSVNKGEFRGKFLKPIPLEKNVPESLELYDSDFLITRSNTRDRVGDCCIVSDVRQKTIFSDLIYRITLGKTIVPRFLVLLLLTQIGRNQIEISARGSSGTMPKISHNHIKSIRITFPPLEEQKNIVTWVEATTVSLAQAINQAEREIELIREYRIRLISDVVTGQVDVRAIEVPEVVEEDLLDLEEDPAEAIDNELEAEEDE